MRSRLLILFSLVLASQFCSPGAASASSRRVASTYLACSSIGQPLADLQADFSRAGVYFEETEPGTVRVGYEQFWFFRHWLCQLAVNSTGVVVGSQRLP
jgi:hypothetical protein